MQRTLVRDDDLVLLVRVIDEGDHHVVITTLHQVLAVERYYAETSRSLQCAR